MTNTVHFSNTPELYEEANRLFERTKISISRLLPAAEVHHIGSTAIPGSLTKGDLEIAIRIRAADFAAADNVLSKEFERNVGSDRTESFSAFLDITTSPELGIQLVVIGSELDNFVEWRRRLEDDVNVRTEYDSLKSRFEGEDMEKYRLAKSRFIAKHLGN
jgi:GrpB-like predicted nucleotidyltransferase (UPF0157 family)